MNTKKIFSIIVCLVLALSTMLLPCVCFANDADDTESGFEEVAEPIIDLINSALTIILSLVFAVGAIYCVFLGVKFAKAEEPQDREKAKAHLKNAIIGFVLIFVLILALRLLAPVMTQWLSSNT